jgi:YesN/AraC family two-component response regulator
MVNITTLHLRPSVLVVDDEPNICDAVAMALRDRYHVHAALCGADAIARLQAHRIALIILDALLGSERGLDFVPRFRAVRPAPILLLTAHGSVELIAEALRLRVDDYRSKPVSVPDLRAAVDRLVGPAILPADLAASIQRVLDREFAKPLQFADLAGQFGISEAHLRRLFRTVRGKTPRRYVIETRLQHAATLLRTTAHRVEYIAAEVGYPTSTLFDRAFRVLFGMTPSEYRTRMRE